MKKAIHTRTIFCWLVGFLVCLPILSAHAQLPPLIPREVLFDNPVHTVPQISPDGKRIAYLAPSKEGVLNVWVRTLGQKDDRMVTQDQRRGIRYFAWVHNNEHLIYIQDQGGDENWHVYSTQLATSLVRDLTPFQGIRAQNIQLSKKHPNQIMVGLNIRTRQLFDMYRIDLTTGAVVQDTLNPGAVIAWITDADFVLRAHLATNPADGGTILRVRDAADKPWRDLITWPFGESGDPVSFSQDGKSLYVRSTLQSNTSRLLQIDVATGKTLKELAVDPNSDIGEVWIHPDSRIVLAVSFNYLKPQWKVLDPSIQADLTLLAKHQPGSLFVMNGDRDYQNWIVGYDVDNGPIAFYHYDRQQKKLNFLFVSRPNLAKYKLASMQPVIIEARDKMKLVSYLTLPLQVAPKNLPMVLLVHGGPWHRDSWGYSGFAQWLANRGYAVLQVNFRGSDGFGKAFLNAGNGEWARRMQDDLTDAVQWAIRQGTADPKRIAIMGGSYGGYATLAGLTFTPELYACGVDIVGPSNIRTLLQSFPPYWGPFKKMWAMRVGDAEKDDVLNRRISPLFHADKIRVPLLIGHGANDPRVKQQESDEIVRVLREKKREVVYIVYPDEGHGFARPPNNLDFFGRTDEFLAKCLQGRSEPWKKIPGTTAQVK